MDISTTIQYWAIMVFMQFAPLNEINQGSIYKYSINKSDDVKIVFEIVHVNSEDLENIHWIIKSKYEGKNTSNETYTAYIKSDEANGVHLVSLKTNDVESLQKGEIVKFPNSEKNVIISSDDNFLLKCTKDSNLNTKFGESEVACEKHLYQKGNISFEIINQEIYGLMELKIVDPTIGEPIIMTMR